MCRRDQFKEVNNRETHLMSKQRHGKTRAKFK
jgi:hypothetical protein